MSDILVMKNITKKFPGVTALNNVTFSCKKGEVHALMGENGAGKSTLIKLLSGASTPTSGEIFFEGKPLKAKTPHDVQDLGIAIIHQELNLVPNMNAVENIFLGREIKNGQFVNFKEMKKRSQEILRSLNIKINLEVPVRKLSVAQQQMIEIAKALSMDASFIIMDEPTASLTNNEIDALFEIVCSLKEKGVTIIFISHHLSEIFECADRVTVLKDGEYIGTKDIDEIDESSLIRMMVGRELSEIYPDISSVNKTPILEVKGLSRKGVLDNINFTANKGEVLGIAGLVGSGRTELARAIFGADKIDSGVIKIDGKEVTINQSIDAMKQGIGFVTEDRKSQGLILGLTIRENICISLLKSITNKAFVNKYKEKEIANRYIKSLKIATPSMEAKAVNLSGGNQQKVVLGKWLARECRIIILDEPTRGIDVGAKVEIYNLMRELSNNGTAVIMISSELPEIIGMSDRVLVMREGRINGELTHEEVTEEKILEYAMGGCN